MLMIFEVLHQSHCISIVVTSLQYDPKKSATHGLSIKNVEQWYTNQQLPMAAMAQEAAKPLDYRGWSGTGSCWADYDYHWVVPLAKVTRGEAKMSKASGKSVLDKEILQFEIAVQCS